MGFFFFVDSLSAAKGWPLLKELGLGRVPGLDNSLNS
jgi:hypothetical protein